MIDRVAKNEIAAKFHYRARKSLGQHFLTARGVVLDIIKAANIKIGETVLEIGPGKGILTEALLEAGAKVIAIEKDARMIGVLKEKFAPEIKNGHLNLVCGDILELRPSDYQLKTTDYKLISNIPYYITGEILRKFIGGKVKPSRAVLLVQKEVAERIVAKTDKPFDSAQGKESILSISIKIYGTPKYVEKVPAGCFSPVPKVDSAILLIENIRNPFLSEQEENNFFTALKSGFAHKRKLLAGNLSSFFGREKIGVFFARCGIGEKARAENLSVKDWLCLARGI